MSEWENFFFFLNFMGLRVVSSGFPQSNPSGSDIYTITRRKKMGAGQGGWWVGQFKIYWGWKISYVKGGRGGGGKLKETPYRSALPV